MFRRTYEFLSHSGPDFVPTPEYELVRDFPDIDVSLRPNFAHSTPAHPSEAGR